MALPTQQEAVAMPSFICDRPPFIAGHRPAFDLVNLKTVPWKHFHARHATPRPAVLPFTTADLDGVVVGNRSSLSHLFLV